MRRASRLQPGDHALLRRIADLETGYAVYARKRRRRLVTLATAAGVSGVLALAGVMEFVAAREVIATFDSNLEDVTRGAPAAAVVGLEHVRSSFGWTGSGRAAGRLVQRLIELQVRAAQEALAADDPARAIDVLERQRGVVDRRDQVRRLDALLRQARLERHARELLAAATAQPPLESAARDLARLVDPELLGFHLRHVEQAEGAAKVALLSALRAIDSPQTIATAARLYVAGADPLHLRALEAILETAARHRAAGASEAWAGVLPELVRRARDVDAGAERAQRVLGWLQGR
jgi:hypothetical protein